MSVIINFFNFIWFAFSKVWEFIQNGLSSLTGLFTNFSSVISELLQDWGIYTIIYNSLDTLNGLAETFNGYVSQSTMVGTITSFFAFDTLYTVVLTVVGSTFGVVLAVVGLFLGVLIPALFVFITFRISCRFWRFVTAGIFKP